jgi:hypothetical protein
MAEIKIQNYRLQRNQLKNKLIINESNKLLVYKYHIDEFLKKIRGVINGELTSKLTGLDIKSKIKQFCDVTENINYTGKFNFQEINLMISQCGGSRDLYTKINEEILISMIFKDDKSPAKHLESLMKQYIELIVKLFRDIIFEIDFSYNQLDPQFWNNLKEKLITNIDKKYVFDGLMMLCVAQESYFDFEPSYVNIGEKKREPLIYVANEQKGNNVENSGVKYVLSVMELIWKKYLFTVRLQFGKYIQKHFIEYNLSEAKMDNIFNKIP